MLVALLLGIGFGYGVTQLLRPVFGADFQAIVSYSVMRSAPTGKVVIVAIDNASLDSLAKNDLRIFTFSKQVYSDLFDRLNTAGARAIGLDVVLANPDPTETGLVKTLEKYNNITIATKVGIDGGEQVSPRSIFPEKYWSMIDLISEYGYLRGLKLTHSTERQSTEPFAHRVYRLYTREPAWAWLTRSPAWLLASGERYQVSLLRSVVVNSQGSSLIPFSHEIGGFTRYSLSDVLAGKFPEGAFRDKAVLIGEYGTLIHDAHKSPLSQRVDMPGVEFHANLLDSLLSNSPLAPVKNEVNWAIILMVAVGTFWIVATRKLWGNILWLVGAPVGLVFVTWYLHAGQGLLIDIWMIFCTGFIAPVVAAGIYRYRSLDARGRFLRQAFVRYIAPELVDQIAANPDICSLGGQKRELAILFSDIEGFTRISETLEAPVLFAFMNEYLSEMTEILIAQRGTLDKYIGDAVMGFFGAPVPLEHPVRAACLTALAMQSRLRELAPVWQARGIPPIMTRIGLHTAEVMVGNIGSATRFSYTVLGDGVNLASRLEGVNKEYHTNICVSGEIVALAGEGFTFRKLDRIRVKGRDSALDVYELLHDYLSARVAPYEAALEVYFSGDYQAARVAFGALEGDPVAEVMARRCDAILSGAVVLRDWAFTMEGK